MNPMMIIHSNAYAHNGFLPPANEVWGKVICLHLSVILSGGCLVWGCLVLGVRPQGGLVLGVPGPGGCVPDPGGRGGWWRPPGQLLPCFTIFK